ncbi:hypothetical protein ACRRTK_012148 [Alexandromys fortis]
MAPMFLWLEKTRAAAAAVLHPALAGLQLGLSLLSEKHPLSFIRIAPQSEASGNHTPPQLSPSLSQSTYTTGGSLDVPHIIMQGDARRRRNENYFDDIPRSKLERQMAQEFSCLEKTEWTFLRPGEENPKAESRLAGLVGCGRAAASPFIYLAGSTNSDRMTGGDGLHRQPGAY